MVSHTENLNLPTTGGEIMEEPRTTLPLDILLHIIDLLAGGNHEDIRSLHILSQTCKYLESPCHKYLFSKFSCLLLLRGTNLERKSDLLLKNPWIARYVRTLTYILSPPFSNHDLNVIDILKKHSSESFDSIQLSLSERMKWNHLPESIRSSLVSLIQLPTVTYLKIDIIGFPATALSGCSNLMILNLKALKLDPPRGKISTLVSLSMSKTRGLVALLNPANLLCPEAHKFDPPEVNQVISRRKISTPLSLYMSKTNGLVALLSPAGGPIINFSRLQKAVFSVESEDDIGEVNELIKVTSRLEHICLQRE